VRHVYPDTYRMMLKMLPRFGITVEFVDGGDADTVARALPGARLLYLESPTSWVFETQDLPRLAALARAAGVITVIDNSWASPIFQRPIEHGVDLVLHSASKYLGGHSDVVAGALVMRRDDLHEKLAFLQNAVGAVPGPLDSFLVLRGLKTLHVRMERHDQNARLVAQALQRHPKVEKVTWPGLPEHPQHALAAKQMRGFGGMLTCVVRGGLPAASTVLKSVRLFACAESLGGVESLIEHPAIMTHASVPPETRRLLGIDDGFIRLSVGIEDLTDLQGDLERAFRAAR